MKGALYIIPAERNQPHTRLDVIGAVSRMRLEHIVGGPPQAIPHFDSILEDGRVVPCAAFCHESGKLVGLPPNDWAQILWILSLGRKFGAGHSSPGDVLAGPVVVVFGSAELLNTLSAG